jgi:hypothetical protein
VRNKVLREAFRYMCGKDWACPYLIQGTADRGAVDGGYEFIEDSIGAPGRVEFRVYDSWFRVPARIGAGRLRPLAPGDIKAFGVLFGPKQKPPGRRLFLFSLYKFRIPSLDEFTARFWTCGGYEYSTEWKGVGGRTVLWSGRRGVDKISTEERKSAYLGRLLLPGCW